jgi:hypothetical protein
MDIEKNIVVVESAGGFDGPSTWEDVRTNHFDMENVRPTLGNSLENEVLQLTIIQVQVALWILDQWGSIWWGYFVMFCPKLFFDKGFDNSIIRFKELNPWKLVLIFRITCLR